MKNKELLKKIGEIVFVALLSVAGIYFLGQRFYQSREIPSEKALTITLDESTLEFDQGRLVATTSTPITDGIMIPATNTFSALVYAPKVIVTDGIFYKKKLHSFSYTSHGPQMLEIAGGCTDVYYTTLIFSVNDDYTKNPSSARYNQAEICPKSKSFDKLIDLSKLNLPEGKYYFFVADQGTNKPWYNPR